MCSSPTTVNPGGSVTPGRTPCLYALYAKPPSNQCFSDTPAPSEILSPSLVQHTNASVTTLRENRHQYSVAPLSYHYATLLASRLLTTNYDSSGTAIKLPALIQNPIFEAKNRCHCSAKIRKSHIKRTALFLVSSGYRLRGRGQYQTLIIPLFLHD